jgi:hypothetical protein
LVALQTPRHQQACHSDEPLVQAISLLLMAEHVRKLVQLCCNCAVLPAAARCNTNLVASQLARISHI